MALGVPSAHLGENHQEEDTIDDDWCEDGSDALELERELRTKENEFHKMGYRDGVIAGKEVAAQDGFNVGYKQAVLSGYNWGMVRGVTSALAGLPASLKDKLAATSESKDILGRLYESVKSISSDDALKMFHEDMSSLESKKSHSQAEESCSAEVSAYEAAAGCGQLDTYLGKLESLITSGFSDVELHWERKTIVHKE